MQENINRNQDNLMNFEALIIEDLFNLIKQNKISLTVVPTSSKWFGVTYRNDKDSVVKEINKMIENKEYPSNLWS